ncbi:hypothetical protein DM860_004230 [Cuscuta australis]|uniref:Membrane-bound transcription factor site-1 protease-like N-terminal domain-containing protein n=1 Tax=Cuscuta australis TaxID=267555 RepID=A0A328EAX7_9ASTE|nr:hypothetical protein DM860_004230 [Cuscuta australis]
MRCTHGLPFFTLPLVLLIFSFVLRLFHPLLFVHYPESARDQPLSRSTLKPKDVGHNHHEVQKRESSSRNNYIVRFTKYLKSEYHRTYLQGNVKLNGWEWIERKNPASRFPTDFAVVAIEESMIELLIDEFTKLKFVKDVSLDLSYQRGVLAKKNDRIGGFFDGKKRPGKIFTSMSFTEGEQNEGKRNVISNTSNMEISWKRELLMQKHFGQKDTPALKLKWLFLTQAFDQIILIFVISRSVQIGPMKIHLMTI